MVRSHTKADEAVWNGQPLVHVDEGVVVLTQKEVSEVEAAAPNSNYIICLV